MRARPSEWRLPQPGESLAEYVRAARKGRRLSVDEMVRRTGLSSAALRKIEGGSTRNPGLFTLRPIWRTLILPVAAFDRLPEPAGDRVTD